MDSDLSSDPCHVGELDIRWTAPEGDGQRDARWAKSLGMSIYADSDSSWVATAFAFPAKPLEPGVAFLSLTLSRETSTGVPCLRWALRVSRMPSAPPAEVQARAERFGGYPDVLEKLAPLWGAKEHLITARCEFHLEHPHWKPRFPFPRSKAFDYDGTKHKLTPQEVTLAIRPPARGLVQLRYARRKRSHADLAIVRGESIIMTDAKVLTRVEEELWRATKPFFARTG